MLIWMRSVIQDTFLYTVNLREPTGIREEQFCIQHDGMEEFLIGKRTEHRMELSASHPDQNAYPLWIY